MSSIKSISYSDMVSTIDTYYLGWPADKLTALKKQYQAKYYGDIDDARFEIVDDEGEIYYAIFRTAADEWTVNKAKDYLLSKDQNRVLLNVGGKLYRFLIKEKILLSTACYDEIIGNDFDKVNSWYFHSIAAPSHEVMVVVDNEGIAAINWDKILWRYEFELTYCGNLELVSIKDNHVIAKYDDCCDLYSIEFDLQNGTYEMKPYNTV